MLSDGAFRQFSSAALGPAALKHALEAMEPSLSFFVDQHKDRTSELDVSMRLMDGAFVTQQYMAGLSTLRQKHHIARDGNHDLILFISQHGQPFHMKSPDRPHGRDEFTIRPGGGGLLVGNDEQFEIRFPGSGTIGISIPRDRVVAATANLDAAFLHGIPRTGALNLLGGYAKTLTSDIGPMDGATVFQMGETLADLFILALGPTRDAAEAAKGSARAAMLARLKADISANLARHDLSIDLLAARHGIRARVVQDLFYAAGESFTAHLLEARLDEARRLLLDPATGHAKIAQIAAMSGFGDISWFNNAFRKRFGLTPSDMRMGAAPGPQNSSNN